MAENDASHELALTIINDGAGYQNRCAIARRTATIDATGKGTARQDDAQHAAYAWQRVASDGARAYERQFGSYGVSSFTAQDILAAAIELADYYAAHVAEG